MPNYKNNKSNNVKVRSSVKSSGIRASLPDLDAKKLAGYMKRQGERRELESVASKRFTEISNMQKEKQQLRDEHAPVPIKERTANTAQKLVKYLKAHRAPRDKRAARHINPKHLLGIFAALCLALIVLSNMSETVRLPFKKAAAVFVVPVQKGVNAIGLWLSDKIEAQKTLDELKEENRTLREQLDDLTLEVTALRQQEQELERVQALLKLSDEYYNYETEAAHVIAKSPGKWFSTFTIDKGSNDGIRLDMNVVASGGLVGIVADVGDNYSTVRAIIDDGSSVSAQFEGNSELCMLNGSLALMEDNIIAFTDVSADVLISENDAIITSHVSSKYMPGLLIGYVVDYQLDSNDLTQSGHIKPVVDFADLEEVLIITKVKEVSD